MTRVNDDSKYRHVKHSLDVDITTDVTISFTIDVTNACTPRGGGVAVLGHRIALRQRAERTGGAMDGAESDA
jgi:hypothetical protein